MTIAVPPSPDDIIILRWMEDTDQHLFAGAKASPGLSLLALYVNDRKRYNALLMQAKIHIITLSEEVA